MAQAFFLSLIQGVYQKNPQTIEASTKLNVKRCKIYWQGAYIKYWRIKKLKYLCKAHDRFSALGINHVGLT